MSKPDYAGKEVFVGIDVHRKKYACVSVCDRECVKTDTIHATPETLVSYIHTHFEGATVHAAYEAGFAGFHLHRELLSAGIHSHVIHAASIPMGKRHRIKTDMKDAKKIALSLSAGILQDVRIPSLEHEFSRSGSRFRSYCVKWRRQVAQTFKALLLTQGLIAVEDRTVLTEKWLSDKIKMIEALCYPADYVYTLKCYQEVWIFFTNFLAVLEKKLLSIDDESDQYLLDLYRSVPGIGVTAALMLKNELGDMLDFANEKQFFSYLGLVPLESTSGDKTHKHLTARGGRGDLRSCFIEAAWVAIKQDVTLMEIYARHVAQVAGGKKNGKKAITVVARRLAGRVRSCIKKNMKYENSSTAY